MFRSALIITAIALAGCSQAENTADTSSETVAEIAPTDHPFDFMFGEWTGTATGSSQSGPYEVVQTERVGPMLGGDVVVVNGTGYGDDGTAQFEALGIISRTPDGSGWQMTSWSGGRQGTFPLTLDGTDYSWELPAGPDAKMVYSATIDGDDWTSVGTYVREGMNPVETFRMTLTRAGGTGWPAANPVSYR